MLPDDVRCFGVGALPRTPAAARTARRNHYCGVAALAAAQSCRHHSRVVNAGGRCSGVAAWNMALAAAQNCRHHSRVVNAGGRCSGVAAWNVALAAAQNCRQHSRVVNAGGRCSGVAAWNVALAAQSCRHSGVAVLLHKEPHSVRSQPLKTLLPPPPLMKAQRLACRIVRRQGVPSLCFPQIPGH